MTLHFRRRGFQLERSTSKFASLSGGPLRGTKTTKTTKSSSGLVETQADGHSEKKMVVFVCYKRLTREENAWTVTACPSYAVAEWVCTELHHHKSLDNYSCWIVVRSHWLTSPLNYLPPKYHTAVPGPTIRRFRVQAAYNEEDRTSLWGLVV